jgi:hypothetical protein
MNFEQKYLKYKEKYLNLKNLITGGEGGKKNIVPNCIKTPQKIKENLETTCYIDNPENDPTLKKISRFLHSTAVCSFSLWNKDKTQSYVPTNPTESDKIFSNREYYYRIYFIKNNEDKQLTPDNKCLQIGIILIIWSPVKSKWYTLSNFPEDKDNTLSNISKEFDLWDDDGILTGYTLQTVIILWLTLLHKIDSEYYDSKKYNNDESKESEIISDIFSISTHQNNEPVNITNPVILNEYKKYKKYTDGKRNTSILSKTQIIKQISNRHLYLKQRNIYNTR